MTGPDVVVGLHVPGGLPASAPSAAGAGESRSNVQADLDAWAVSAPTRLAGPGVEHSP